MEQTAKGDWFVRFAFVLCTVAAWLAYAASPHNARFFYRAMANNALLAYIPVEISMHLAGGSRKWLFWTLLPAWLVFFPNAPYVLTDYFHLAYVDPYVILENGKRVARIRPDTGLWVRFAVVSLIAIAGAAFGIWSLDRTVDAIMARFRRSGACWRFSLVAAFAVLSSIGIYLGRFPRLHSIHLLTKPMYAAERIAGSCGMNLVEFAALLTLVQLALWGCLRFLYSQSKRATPVDAAHEYGRSGGI